MTKDRWSNVLFAGVLFLLIGTPFYKVGFPLWIGVVLSAIGAIGLTFKGEISKKIVPFVYLVTAFFVMELIWILFVPDQQNAFKNILLKTSLLVIPWSLLAVNHGFSRKQFHALFGAFLASSVLSGAVHLTLAIQQTIENQRLMIFYQDLSQWVHPGYYGILIALAIIVGITVKFDGNASVRFLSKWIKPIGVLFLIAILFLLSARMQLIAMIVIFLFSGTSLLIRKMGKRKATLYTILLLLIAGSSTALLFKHNNRINRLYSEVQDLTMKPGDYLNSVETRLVIWQLGIETAMERPFTGHGTASTKTLVVKKASTIGHLQIVQKNMGVHNEFLDAWITKGLVGLLLLIVTLGQPLVQAIRNQNHFLLSVLILFGLTFLTESALEREMGVILFATFVPLTMLYHQSKENVGG
ncbi:MAG: O-antigen ligase [Granulosicoccus sp.]|jgi:O-antigen ligase